ncbi:MAG: phosphoribosylformylglycinamidine cyclo-ligase [Actinobacteria bacterium]|jgi:phosphoribosylformylglycinamidine cyclo-ligase|nr:phosphoribosylformylglycinamidine cyclo-ligase [Actinomycetota bacterium]MBT3746610.1 phosphoribosylformylglycinamidine cyclo-ligase [Actinomycetota bacterium]MBT3970246.1 phosphoribosylformylglycinamidine cyclo-ligase [Actinomycetota bacterium]MBT4009793.1 phosphoribosylformylglycinamidine cyclo-ligase [Actinomycetota bacterium]MBT4303854.1 phosphoribosylformylglycinamidine cyclo-ligase [Actinomycetota bacterium]
MSDAYRAAGVDIDAGEEAVQRIIPHVRSTYRPGVMGDIGGFGGLFDLAKTGYTDPLLVSATDGVGTKAEIARMTGRFDTIGQDLVAMCVDDLICVGAAPLFFLDYVAVGQLVPEVMEQLVAGIANGCRTAGCALIGGEMAEHPGVMETAQFDLVGFAVGAVERSKVLDGSQVAAGDVLVALESPNLRSNGFSLARRIVFEVAECSLGEPAWEGAETTLADELLAPSVIYAPAVGAVLAEHEVHAVAHITGGGLIGNLPRVMGTEVDALVDTKAWTPPRIFAELQAMGDISDEEMGRVFNMGVGMVLVVPQSQADGVLNTLATQEQRASIIGQLVHGSGCVTFDR